MSPLFKKRLLVVALASAMSPAVWAVEEVERLEQVSVVGGASGVSQQAGSVQVVTEARLEQNEYTDIHRILREVPGVNIQEEDGFGLRPNIGLRGTGVGRSSNITLMEDGVLIAPAPYASPAAYYFPSAPRIAGVEVSKGPAAIQYGPRTLGGAINLLSRPIPAGEGGGIDLSGGQFGHYKMHGHYGASGETFGSMLEVLRYGSDGFKDLDGGGNTGFDKNDVTAKFRINSAPDAKRYQELNIKLGYADETSNMSYLGLTEADFDNDPYRRYAASQEDVMENDHTQIQLNHYIELSDAVELDTVVYRNDFKRNWYKVDKVNGEKIGSILTDPALAGALAVTRGEAAGTVDVKANNREYLSQGIQGALGIRFDTGVAKHKLTLGARYHEDEMDRYQWVDKYDMDANGNMTLNSGGVPGTESNRVESAKALALYAHDKVSYGKWGFQGGMRFENIDTRRVDYGKTDPGRDTNPKAEKNNIQVWVPGLGATYQATDRLQLLAGVHKGFAPAGPGDSEADAEESVNYELGARWNERNLNLELVGFYNDYRNLLGSCTAASGSNCDIGDQFNAGEVDIQGLEATVGYTLSSGGTRYPLQAVYTYTDAEFQSSFEDGFWGAVDSGDKMPYLAPQQLYLSAGVEKTDWSAYLSAKFMDEMRTEAGSGSIANDESVEAHTVFDLAAHYNVMKDAQAYLKVENLTDEAYMVSRRPAGVRAGMPRTFTVGYKMDF